MQISGDSIRNLIALSSLGVSLIALTLSGSAFRYQYRDFIVANVSATGFAIKGRFRENVDDQKHIVSITAEELYGGLSVTIFNSGNREISLNVVSVYLQPGDYQTLVNVDPTPPCVAAPGSKIIYDLKGTALFSDAKVVEAQHILSIPINFPLFSPLTTTGVVEQGIVCLKLQAFDYLGHGNEIQYPVALIRAVQGTIPFPGLPPFSYGNPRGSKLNDMHSLF